MVDKGAAIEPDHPTLIPGIHVVHGEKGLWQVVLLPPHRGWSAHRSKTKQNKIR